MSSGGTTTLPRSWRAYDRGKAVFRRSGKSLKASGRFFWPDRSVKDAPFAGPVQPPFFRPRPERGRRLGRRVLDSLDDPVRFAGRLIGHAEQLLGVDLSGAPVEYQVFQENLRYVLGAYVIADGEWCSWREDEDLGVVVKREPWSLLGTGETLQAALADYREEAKSLAHLMEHDDPAELTDEARRMRDTLTKRYLLAHD